VKGRDVLSRIHWLVKCQVFEMTIELNWSCIALCGVKGYRIEVYRM